MEKILRWSLKKNKKKYLQTTMPPGYNHEWIKKSI